MPQSNASGSDISASQGFPTSGAGQKFQTPRRGVSRTAAPLPSSGSYPYPFHLVEGDRVGAAVVHIHRGPERIGAGRRAIDPLTGGLKDA